MVDKGMRCVICDSPLTDKNHERGSACKHCVADFIAENEMIERHAREMQEIREAAEREAAEDALEEDRRFWERKRAADYDRWVVDHSDEY